MIEPYKYEFLENFLVSLVILGVYLVLRLRASVDGRRHAYQFLVAMFVLSSLGSLTVLPVALYRLDSGMIAWQGMWVGLGVAFAYDAYRRWRARDILKRIELSRAYVASGNPILVTVYDKNGRQISP